MIQYISMILGVAIIVYMMLRNWSPIITGIVAAALVILMNGLPYGTTMMDTYFGAFAGMFKSLFPPIFSGCLIAQLYIRSGAVVTIADKLCNAMFGKTSSASRKYTMAILSMVIASGGISFCGINSLVVLIAMYPIALRIMERAGIPKRFVMGILSGGVYTFALSAPGTTETVNILAMQALGTPSYAGLYGGLIAVIAEVTMMTVILTKMIKKAVLNGETFAYGSRDIHWDEDENAAKRPGLIISLIPLLVLIIIFNFFSVNIFMATMIGWLLALILFWKYIDGRKEVMEICVEGGKDAFGPISSVGSLVGFTSVVQLLPGFQTLLDSIFTIDVSPVIILILAISLVAGLTGSSTSAVRIGIPLIAERCTAAGLSLSFIHRVSCFACTTIDTLPWSTAIVINLGIADLKLKDAYPPMFVSTCLSTLCGTIICSLFMYVFPNLP